MQDKEKKLTESEEQIMAVLMDSEEDLSVSETRNYVNQRFKHTWKEQTVATLLTRMEEKGYVLGYKSGKCRYYSIIIRPEEYREKRSVDLCDLLFGGNMDKMKEFVKMI